MNVSNLEGIAMSYNSYHITILQSLYPSLLHSLSLEPYLSFGLQGQISPAQNMFLC